MMKCRIHTLLLIGFTFLLTNCTVTQGQKNSKPENIDRKVLTPHDVEVISLYYEATTQMMLSNDDEALLLFLRVIEKDPQNAGAHYEVARIYSDKKHPDQALEFAKKSVEFDDKNKWFLITYIDLLIENGKLKEASKATDELLKIEPKNQDFQLQKADILISLKDYKNAIKIYNKLENEIGINDEIVLQKQKLYLAQGKYDDAEREMQKLIDSNPDESEYYGMFAEFYLTINKKEKALLMYEKVLEMDPENPIIHLALAKYYQDINNPSKAFDNIKLAFKNPNVKIDNKVKIMLSYYDLSSNNTARKEEALELLEILLLVNSDEPKAWSIKGDFNVRDGLYSDAILAFEKVLELEQGKYPVWDQLIQLYMQENMFDKMASQSEVALEYFPNLPQFYYYNGWANSKIGNYSEAITQYKNGKDLVINDPGQKILFWIGIAECYENMEDLSKSQSSYESALATSGNSVLVLTSYANFLCKYGIDLGKADNLINRADQIEPRNFNILDIQAWIKFKSKDYKNALLFIEKAIQFGGGEYADIVEHYGDILFVNGDKTKALDEWKKAKDLKKGTPSPNLDKKILEQNLIE